MKKLLLTLFVALCVSCFFACEEESNDGPVFVEYDYSKAPVPAQAKFTSAVVHVQLPDQYNYLTNNPGTTIADESTWLASLCTTRADNIVYEDSTTVSGYPIEQFISKDTVKTNTPDLENALGTSDPRELYSVVTVSNDAKPFDNRTMFTKKGTFNTDLRWDQFVQCYLLDLNYDAKIYFPESVGLGIKMYNIKYAYDIYMFRKIDVKRPDSAGSMVTFEVAATTDSFIDDTKYTEVTATDTTAGLQATKFTVTTVSFGSYTDAKAISLDQFITTYVTDDPSGYTYTILALDGTSKSGWTYDNIKNSFYLTEYDFVCQVDSTNDTMTMVSGTKVHFPVRIELAR